MRELDRTPLVIRAVHDQPIPVRDGTILRADVQRPATDEPVPTLLVRNPYGEAMGRSIPVVPALEAGFAVVIQHCRGRGTSDGLFEPWRHEPGDGADTVRWITAQPWSSGKVVGWGLSYLAGTALQTAIEKPEGYVGVVAAQTPADFYDDLTYVGGALALGSAQGWATMQGMLGGMHATLAGEDAGPMLGAALPAMFAPESARAALPLRDAAGLPTAAPYWADWLDHPTRDEYWTSFASPRDNYGAIDLPVYHVGGWYDLFLAGTLENHAGLGGPLVIGPWTHGGLHASGAGQVSFGPGSPAPIRQLEADQLAFLTEAVEGRPGTRPPVRIFVMGTNTWRDEQEWPLARTQFTPWYLQAGGSLGPETSSGASRYVADPRDPVPTVGGPLLFPEFNAAGPHDQRVLDERPDILRFTSPPLDADLEVTGPLTVVLYAETDAADTDWAAKLIDVHPDGTALNVADGIVRARYGESPYRIDLVATSQVFRAGHSLRIDVASANYPRFDRNPGNGTLSATATEADLTVQHQTVFHDAERASHVLLPMISVS